MHSLRSSTTSSTTSTSSDSSSSCRSASPPLTHHFDHHSHCNNDQHDFESDGQRIVNQSLVPDCEFGPMGTIKRKPISMNPKLPLTSTTRIIANHSADVSRVSDRNPLTRSSSTRVTRFHRPAPQPLLQSDADSGLRNGHKDERMSVNSLMSSTSQESGCRFSHTTSDSSEMDEDIIDDLPLPPPPEPPVSHLTTCVSTLSLSNLPPPPEFVDVNPVSPSSLSSSSSTSSSRCSGSDPPIRYANSSSLGQGLGPESRMLQQQQQSFQQRNRISDVSGDGRVLMRTSADLNPGRKLDPLHSSSSSCSSCEASAAGPAPRPPHYRHGEDKNILSLERHSSHLMQQHHHQSHGSGARVNHMIDNISHPLQYSNQAVAAAEATYDCVSTYQKEAAADSLIASGVAAASASYHYPDRNEVRCPMRGPLPPSPEHFLRNIQRVMEKKWKVAQSLSVGISPPVMGFRETDIIADCIPDFAPDPTQMPLPRLPQQPVAHLTRHSSCAIELRPPDRTTAIMGTIVPAPFKRTKSLVPPKPPKRSESTRLSVMRPDARA